MLTMIIVPFVVTIVATLLFTCYMLFDPADWLASFMQLTPMRTDFQVFILVLGIGYFGVAWTSERYALPRLAKLIGRGVQSIKKSPKERKVYKTVLDSMRI